MKRARLALGYAKDDYWLASDLPAGVLWGGTRGNDVRTAFCTNNVTWNEDLDFSFQFLRVAPGAA